jgi:hypothetical protein
MATYAKYRRAVFNLTGDAVLAANVTVTDESTGALATLFTERTGTGKSNPFVSDAATGIIEFYVQGGAYRIDVVKGTDYSETFRYEANGTLAEHDYDNAKFATGAVGTPSINFSGDEDTGFWNPAANTVALSLGGTEKVRWASSLLSVGMAAVITAAASVGFAVGANGSTNPQFQVDSSASSVATGAKVTGAAAGARVGIAAISSGTNEGLSIDAKGSGTVRLGATSTGAIEFSRNAVPTTSDGAALGTTALMWSDLFLADGAVINYNNGNLTITHATGRLTNSGSLTLSGGVASSSTITGTLIVTGGVGISADLFGVNGAFSTSLTSPLDIGGSATNQTKTFKTTTGVGSGDTHVWTGGNNGATTRLTLSSTALTLGSAVNTITLGDNAGQALIAVNGAATDASISLRSKGTGGIGFQNPSTGYIALFGNSAGSTGTTNYWNFANSAAAGVPVLTVTTGDTNLTSLVALYKGSGRVAFQSTASVEPFSIATGAVIHDGDRVAQFTTQTSSAAAQVGTLTNAPAAGNPGFWMRIKINGTNYAIPAWLG